MQLQHHSEVSPHTVKMTLTKKFTTNMESDVEKREPLYIVDGDVGWCSTWHDMPYGETVC